MKYQNLIEQGDMFKGWSAGSRNINHNYVLPVGHESARYRIFIEVFDESRVSVSDTTFVFTSTVSEYSHLKVHFINVQQGDAILIQTPDNKNIQIDGGYGSRSINRPAWTGSGETIALNYLLRNNVEHLDFIIETHRHEDHWSGLNDIRNSHITVGQNISVSNPRGYRPGDSLTLDSPVRFYFYNIGFPPGISGNINNTSIVLKMIYGDAEFLFEGDAEGLVQSWMLSQGFNLSANVLKVSHHGAQSNNTSTNNYLSQVLNQFASIAILSYGAENPYNHPRSLPRFNRSQTYGTNPIPNPPIADNFHFDSGTIIVWSDGKLVFVSTER